MNELNNLNASRYFYYLSKSFVSCYTVTFRRYLSYIYNWSSIWMNLFYGSKIVHFIFLNTKSQWWCRVCITLLNSCNWFGAEGRTPSRGDSQRIHYQVVVIVTTPQNEKPVNFDHLLLERNQMQKLKMFITTFIFKNGTE